MKLQPDRFNAPAISGYGPGWVAVNGERLDTSVVLGSEGFRQPWNCRDFAELSAAHFELLARPDAEIVIFGSGSRLRFPQAQWLRPLVERRIGLETMDTPAACRTYNVLASEGRRVVVALLLESVS
jgi:uncharacterized protein